MTGERQVFRAGSMPVLKKEGDKCSKLGRSSTQEIILDMIRKVERLHLSGQKN